MYLAYIGRSAKEAVHLEGFGAPILRGRLGSKHRSNLLLGIEGIPSPRLWYCFSEDEFGPCVLIKKLDCQNCAYKIIPERQSKRY